MNNTIEPLRRTFDDAGASEGGRRNDGRRRSSRCRLISRWSNGGGCDPVGVIRRKPKPRKRGAHTARRSSGDAVTAPMQGTVAKFAVEDGQEVVAGDLVVVLEAMKMENPVTAHKGMAPSLGWRSRRGHHPARCSPRSSPAQLIP